MSDKRSGRGGMAARGGALLLALAAIALPAFGQRVKQAQSPLDKLSFSRPELRVSESLTEADTLKARLAYRSALGRFRAENGQAWHFVVDERTGRVNLLDGGAIPFIPGPANTLKWESFGASCPHLSCIPPARVEALAREFLARYRSVFQVDPAELVLDPAGSVPMGDSIYLLRFQWVYQRVPVVGASVFFIINNGKLVQAGLPKFGKIALDAKPSISSENAWQILGEYVHGIGRDDRILNKGTLVIVPVTPKGMDPDALDVPFGQMIDYVLAYTLAFRRPGVIGTWEAFIDAHTGEILRFSDTNRYGHIQGGVYKTDAPLTEVTVPFPFADYAPGLYADAAGNYPATSGTSTLNGKYVRILSGVTNAEGCDATTTAEISRASDGTGLIDFGGSAGTDCTTPGVGGAGNTHAARTQYWNVTAIKLKAMSYLPTNTWLQGQLTDYVNRYAYCNAYWDGTALNFFKASSPCANTGELPGVSLHEWGHGMDDNDGSGGESPPLETRADWTALLQTHMSCAGAGFLTGNCSGYGNACTGCTGVRDADYANHTNPTPWTPQNKGTVWGTGTSCPSSCFMCYYGPCGWEDHCESGLATQALWDFVNRDLVGSPTSMDLVSAWQLADRLFYTGMPTLGAMYTCTGTTTKVSNGCGAGSLYTVMRAMDDDGDGTANGTPHAAAIFAALNRHGIACGSASDPGNQNQSSCPSLTAPTVTTAVTSSQVAVSWTSGGASATRYFVFRNETSCSAGFTRIATVVAPTLTYADTTVAHGVTYYYRVQAATANDSCVSAMSACDTAAVELAPEKDFYVRDWTSSPASHDDGAQPSTNPVFYHTSDVWNHASNSPGSPNASGWYDTDPMQSGAGAAGNNYAFVRVYRNASGSAASVTAHFFVSPFGTGSSFADAAATADPVVTFGAGDTEQVLSSGYLWHQDATTSTHACLAVQISTPDDPVALPSLLGKTPGPDDYLVIDDNNKAQRNLDVTHSLMHFAGMDYALIHNSALYPRTLSLRCQWPDKLQLGQVTVEIEGGDDVRVANGGTVALDGMQPAENRWIAVHYQLAQKEPVPVTFMEMQGKTPVNGFTVLATPVSLEDLIRENLRTHVQVFNRLAAAFGIKRAAQEVKAADRLLRARTIKPASYVAFLKQRTSSLNATLTPLVRMSPTLPLPPPKREAPAGPFGVTQAVKALTAAARLNHAEQAATVHAALLHRLDAMATALQKAKGDPADALQMVRWQEALYASRPALTALQVSPAVVRASQEFIATYGRDSAGRYKELLHQLSDSFHQTAGALPMSREALERAAAAIDASPADPGALEKAHRQYLLALQKAVGPFEP